MDNHSNFQFYTLIRKMKFGELKNIVEKHWFEIVIGACIVFLLIYALYRKFTKQRGSWDSYYIDFGQQSTTTTRPTKRSAPPKESKGELECRRVLQRLFGKPFGKDRPNFLRNPVTGNFNLELDCVCHELRLAVEYSGVQHYKYIPYFHSSKEAFLNQKYRDLVKETKCRENGYKLIVVPYTVKHEDIEGYLISELRKLGYQL